MPKTEYSIDGRRFHVEKRAKDYWVGWFVDEPTTTFAASLKRDGLDQAGYRPPHPGGLIVSWNGNARNYGPARTMEDAYRDFRSRRAAGHRPRFAHDKPLSKSVILAREECLCVYCGIVPEKSADAHLEHVVPVDAGGKSTAANIITACPGCNARKGNTRRRDEAKRLRKASRRNRVWDIQDDHSVGVPEPAVEPVQSKGQEQ